MQANTSQIGKSCKKHGDGMFYWQKNSRGRGGCWVCTSCRREKHREYMKIHPRRVTKTPAEMRATATFLGQIAERALSKFFDQIEKMPYGNKGFDFICGKGFKIDVKSGCERHYGKHHTTYWAFAIERNEIADYFLCLAFDSRDSLKPQCVWLIPGKEINHKKCLSITAPHLNKWKRFERPLNKVEYCCNKMLKGGNEDGIRKSENATS